MAEPTQFKFSYKELAAMMIREAGVREGVWGILVNFGIAASNVGPSSDELRPAAIVPIMEIGLQRFDSPSNLTVDAREAWAGPGPQPRSRRRRQEQEASA